ncbi:MAG: hypothetical protein ABEI86_10170, partial [Halobacteriaceae archaeon]
KRETKINVNRLDNIQGQANTLDYLRVLEDFDFIRREQDDVMMGEKMEAVDIADESIEDFEKKVVGQIIGDAYFALRDDLDLNMLKHFPKFANAYYISAI